MYLLDEFSTNYSNTHEYEPLLSFSVRASGLRRTGISVSDANGGVSLI